MDNYNFEPGDVLAIGSKSCNGIIISLGTLSLYSHIAVVAENGMVYEYIGKKGLVKSSIEHCLKKAHTVTLFKRNPKLTADQKLLLRKHYKSARLDRSKKPYSTLRSIYSGLLPAFTNVVWLASIGAGIKGWWTGHDNIMAFSGVFTVFIGAVYLARRLARYCQVRGVKLAQEMKGDFCSSFVVLSDAYTGGSLYKYILTAHEPRPSDVVYAAKLSLEYTEIEIDLTKKAVLNSQLD
ncbi:membrane hypothetical protein [Vibrio coralliirubri]|nr:membrane hypothetical protein [Vibrio coralliirubri]